MNQPPVRFRSVFQAEVGAARIDPDYGDYFISTPVAIFFSEDATDDEEIPDMDYTAIKFMITRKDCALGQERIEECVRAASHNLRDIYTTQGVLRIRAALLDYVRKHDISHFGNGYIPEPESQTRH